MCVFLISMIQLLEGGKNRVQAEVWLQQASILGWIQSSDGARGSNHSHILFSPSSLFQAQEILFADYA